MLFTFYMECLMNRDICVNNNVSFINDGYNYYSYTLSLSLALSVYNFAHSISFPNCMVAFKYMYKCALYGFPLCAH